MKLRSLFLTLGSVWLISACGARTNEEEFLGYYGGVEPGTGGGGGSGGFITAGAGGQGAGGRGSGGDFGGSGGLILPSGGRTGVGGEPIGGTGGVLPGNTCCKAHGTTGCNVPFVEECTCNLDSFCCEDHWDDRCVQVADRACFASCESGTGGVPSVGGSPGVGGSSTGGAQSDPGNCCTAHSTPGCQNTDIQECVCKGTTQDSFCCNSQWDDICAFEAETKCGAACSEPQPGAGGSDSTGGSFNCDFAGECGSCLCGNCPAEISDCQGDTGCLAIAWCVQSTGCLASNCYDPSTCQDIIDQFGGLNGPSTSHAVELSLCLLNAGCPCQ